MFHAASFCALLKSHYGEEVQFTSIKGARARIVFAAQREPTMAAFPDRRFLMFYSFMRGMCFPFQGSGASFALFLRALLLEHTFADLSPEGHCNICVVKLLIFFIYCDQSGCLRVSLPLPEVVVGNQSKCSSQRFSL